MPYIHIRDFKGGLDRRRMRATAPAGSLWKLENAHITRGSEIEKAKVWVEAYDLSAKSTFGALKVPGGDIYVFGSVSTPSGLPSGVTYQRLQHPDGLAMTALLSADLYDGKVYAVAEFTGGFRIHFYDAVVVDDWLNGRVRASMTNNDGIATHLKALIDAGEAAVDDGNKVTCSRTGAVLTLTSTENESIDISATALNVEGGTDNQTAAVVVTQEAIETIAEVTASCLVEIVSGSESAGVNKITSIRVNGVEVMSGAVDWATSSIATAAAVAANITAHTSSPNYTATSEGPRVRVSAAAGTGAGSNGLYCYATRAGDVLLSVGTYDGMNFGSSGINPTYQIIGGGTAGVAGQPQIATVTIGGTFEVGDEFTVTVGERNYGASGNPFPVGEYATILRGKVYSLTGGTMAFSGVNTPTEWNEGDAGAGFVQMSTQAAGSENLVAIVPYFNNAAILSERNVQIWFLDTDPDLNQQVQVLNNTGALAAKSVVAFGDSDVFYLADSGIRSLRARDSSNAAYVGDVGTAIDALVGEQYMTLTAAQIAASVGVIEPIDGRYLLAVDDRMYVFSFFPVSKVSAWSTYEPDLTFTWMTQDGRKVYGRADDDKIYLLGGANNDTYDEEVTCLVETPYLSGDDPATKKQFRSFDIACEGTWKVWAGGDPTNPDALDYIGEVAQTTYGLARIAFNLNSTHIYLKLTNQSDGPARIGEIVVHYSTAEKG